MAARIVLPLVLVVGLVLCWAMWVRAPASAEGHSVAAVERSADLLPDKPASGGSFQGEVLARLARIEAALAERDGEGVAAPPASPLAAPSAVEGRRTEGVSVPAEPAVDLEPLEAEIAALARAVEALQQVVRSGETPAQFPSLELLRSAQEANWEQLDVLIELQHARRWDELQARVHWMSQEEVLTTYGRPDSIGNNGWWHYDGSKAGREETLHFIFTSNYVKELMF